MSCVYTQVVVIKLIKFSSYEASSLTYSALNLNKFLIRLVGRHIGFINLSLEFLQAIIYRQ